MQYFSKKLQQLTRGKILREEARQVGIPNATFQRLVRGDVFNPRIEHLVAIAKHYEISVDELLGFGREKEERNTEARAAIEWLQANAKNWFADTQLKDMSDKDIVDIKNFIEKRIAIRKAEEDALRQEKAGNRGSG